MAQITGSDFRTTGVPIPDALTSGSEFTVGLEEGPGYLTIETVRNVDGFYDGAPSFSSISSSNAVSTVFGPYIISTYIGNTISGSLSFIPARDIPANQLLVKVASPIQDIKAFTEGGTPTSQLLLDQYPSASVAYSLRELSTAFVGQPVVRVRRSDNNAEQDFTATEITDGTLETFVGAGNDGFVTTWYDQSGGGNNAVQATASKQPQLVNSGVVIFNNGKPSCVFNLDYLDSSNFLTPDLSIGHTNFMVFEHISQLGNPFDADAILSIASGNNVAQNQRLSDIIISGDTGFPISYSFSTQGGNNSIAVSFTSGQKLLTGLSKDSDCELFFNSLSQGTSTNTSLSPTNIPFKIRFGNVTWSEQVSCNAYITEYILYNTDQLANRTAIETNINSHYNIY